MAIQPPPLHEENVSAFVWKGWFDKLRVEINNIIIGITGIITTKDEGTTLSSSTSVIDFVGAGVTATGAGTTCTVTIPSWLLTTKEEGVNLSTSVSAIDFVGAGVTASGAGATTTVTIPKSINISGTPADNQIALWTAVDTIEGSSLLTWTGARMGVGVVASAWHASAISLDFDTLTTLSQYSSAMYFATNVYRDSAADWKYKTTAAGAYYSQAVGIHYFATTPSGTAGNTATFTNRVIIDNTGHIGVGATPPAWADTSESIDVGAYGSVFSLNNDIYIASNLYFVTGGLKYRNTAAASSHAQTGGSHYFYTIASGTAGNDIGTTSLRMHITLSGHILLFDATERAWDTGTVTNALQLKERTALAERSGTSYLLNNAYFDGTNWKHSVTAAATNLTLGSGLFSIRQVVSGSADANITWATVLQSNSGGSTAVGIASLATTATDGFACIPTCAGTPTGVPTAFAGYAQMVYDTTNNLLYVYDGAAWNLVA